jgi:hypothetical protein
MSCVYGGNIRGLKQSTDELGGITTDNHQIYNSEAGVEWCVTGA